MSSWRLSRPWSRGKPLPSYRSYLRTLYSLFRYQAHPTAPMLASLRGTEREREIQREGEKAKREGERKSAYSLPRTRERHRESVEPAVYISARASIRVLLYLTASSPHLVGNVFCKPKYPSQSRPHAPLSRASGGYLRGTSYRAPLFRRSLGRTIARLNWWDPDPLTFLHARFYAVYVMLAMYICRPGRVRTISSWRD